MPCYNEAATVAEVVGAVLASPYTAELHHRRRRLDRRHARHPGRRSTTRVCACSSSRRTGARARRSAAGSPRPRRLRDRAGRRPRVRPARVRRPARAAARRTRPTSSSARASSPSRPHRVLYFWHSVGNRLLTLASNMFTNLNLTDMETCYKVVPPRGAPVVRRSRRTASGSSPRSPPRSPRGGWRIYEVGISYAGRTYDEGKKIGWRDGVRALYCIAQLLAVWPSGSRARSYDATSAGDGRGGGRRLADDLDSLDDATNYTEWIFELFAPTSVRHPRDRRRPRRAHRALPASAM